MKFFFAVSALLALLQSSQASAAFDDISFGQANLALPQAELNLNEFKIQAISQRSAKLSAEWLPNSIQWIRLPSNLVLPRARMKIHTSSKNSYLKLGERTVAFNDSVENTFEAEVFVSLFQPQKIHVFDSSGEIGSLDVARPTAVAGHLIDYSCASYNVMFEGLASHSVSAGCQLIRVGSLGEEAPVLEVNWSALNAHVAGSSDSSYTNTFSASSSASSLALIDTSGNKLEGKVLATVPRRLNRLKFAGGLGPYQFISKDEGGQRTSGISPSVMLYANFYLADGFSIRGFDAAASSNPTSSAFFNNFGTYFAYELGAAFDRRVQATALLGFQGISYAHNGLSSSVFSQLIFPQGLEISYLHAFGAKNVSLYFGMFLLPSAENPYQNIWIRYGKRVFGELNYITWKNGDKNAEMWGVSVGFPLFSVL